MTAITTPTVYCPRCGTENDEYLERCTACEQLLDPAAVEELALREQAPRPFHVRTFGITAGVALVFVVLFSVLGATFSMAVLPADATPDEQATRLQSLVDEGAVTQTEALHVVSELARQERLRDELAEGKLDGNEALRARELLRPEDQSVVLGMGGIRSFLPPFVAFVLAGAIAGGVARVRRVKELVLGACIPAAAQLVAWLAVAQFEIAAVLTGDLVMMGASFGFNGAPIMLLSMSLVLCLAGATVAGVSAGLAAEAVTGVAACNHCEHRFSLRPEPPTACPKCGAATDRGPKLRYRGDDAFLGALGAPATATTRASTGASELLCLPCARTYAADQCPRHPHEPLLDPTRDDVKFRLLELDAQAGTRRFAAWTADGLGVDAARAVAPIAAGPLLCMACARTYEGDRCPTHRDEPLLDPGDEAVRLELVEADDRARRKVGAGLMFASAGVAMAASIGIAMVLEDGISLSVYVFAGVLVGLVTVSQVLTPRLAPPRFTRWTGQGQVDLDAFGMGAKATIFAPLRRALQRARRDALRIIGVTLGAAALGALVALPLGWPIPAFALLGALLGLLGYGVVASMVGEVQAVAGAARDAKAAWDDPYAS